MWPRKYLLTTTFVASWLQKLGTSMSVCSKTVLPLSFLISALRSLPGDLVVRVDARRGPAALEGEALHALAGEAALVVDWALLLALENGLESGVRGKHLSPVACRLSCVRGCRSTHFSSLSLPLAPTPTGVFWRRSQSTNARPGGGSVKPQTTTSGGTRCVAGLALVAQPKIAVDGQWSVRGVAGDTAWTVSRRFAALRVSVAMGPNPRRNRVPVKWTK